MKDRDDDWRLVSKATVTQMEFLRRIRCGGSVTSPVDTATTALFSNERFARGQEFITLKIDFLFTGGHGNDWGKYCYLGVEKRTVELASLRKGSGPTKGAKLLFQTVADIKSNDAVTCPVSVEY